MASRTLLVNIGTEEDPAYVLPYSVLAITANGGGGVVVLLNNEVGTQVFVPADNPHEVAQRLFDWVDREAQGENPAL